jgi:hypothetical protein
MSTRATYNNSLSNFIADPASIEQVPGRVVNWDGVAAGYVVSSTGKKRLPAGTVVGEFADGRIAEFGATDATVSPEEEATPLGILLTDANEDAPEEALTGYGILVGGVLFENLLPDATGGPPKALASQTKTDLVTAGCTFKFVVYADSRAE